MLQTTKENLIYKTFILISLLICPLAGLAPLGSWLPLALAAIICFLFNENLYKKKIILEIPIVIHIAFFWIIISAIFIEKNFFAIEKVFYFIALLLFGLIVIKTNINSYNLKKIIVVFSISFILSTLLIILDSKINLGIKLWLSKNFDSSNFKSFYELKGWTTFSDFRKNNFDQIISYNNTAYSRGVISLTVLALPLSILCFFFNRKILAYVVLTFNFLLLFLGSSLTAILSFSVAFFFGIIFYFQNTLLKKYLLWLLGIYFLFCPFTLGKLDYNKFSEHENLLLNKRSDLFVKYCNDDINNHHVLIRKKYTLYLYCNAHHFDKQTNYTNYYYPLEQNIKQNNFNKSFQDENSKEKIKIFLNYSLYTIASTKLHRLMIWSYVKEKILDRPLIGHGFFSSRNIANKLRNTQSGTNYQLIPLHPHNSILQIWLELGIIGIIIFFYFIKFILDKIFYYVQINRSVATIAFITFFQVFTIGQISFGFWQSWWLAIVLITLILYKYVFRCFKSHALQSDSLD